MLFVINSSVSCKNSYHYWWNRAPKHRRFWDADNSRKSRALFFWRLQQIFPEALGIKCYNKDILVDYLMSAPARSKNSLLSVYFCISIMSPLQLPYGTHFTSVPVCIGPVPPDNYLSELNNLPTAGAVALYGRDSCVYVNWKITETLD